MSGAVNIIANISHFDEKQNMPFGQLRQFHDQNGFCDIVGEQEKTYEQGFKEGYAQALEQENGHANLIDALEQTFAGIKTEIETGHRHVVTTLMQAALPALTKKHMTAEITDFVMSLAACALDGQLALFAHPDLEPKLKQIVQSIDSADDTRSTFTIKTNAQISGRAVRATWQGGGGTIDLEHTVKKLLTRIEQN